MIYTLETGYPVAADSPDHLSPHGTMNGGTSSRRFIREMECIIGKPMRVLCLGCSGGRAVADWLATGHEAVGLEGSDYHATRGSGQWGKLAGKHLFTCDISRPFQVLRDGNPAEFDLITTWDVLEHIANDRLDTLLDSMHRHLAPGGLWFGTIGLMESIHPVTGAVLHLTVESADWWHERVSPWFDDIGTDKLSTEAWYDMICWHGRNRQLRRPGDGCFDRSAHMAKKKRQ